MRFILLPHHGKQPKLVEAPWLHIDSERSFKLFIRKDDCFAGLCDIDIISTWAARDQAQETWLR